jgi:hypothetical protein
MFSSSQDILNITKAVSILALAGFTCWFIYYLARIMQQIFNIIKEMRDRINKVDELMKAIKDKIDHSTSYLLLIVEGVRKLVEVVEKKSEEWAEKRKRSLDE